MSFLTAGATRAVRSGGLALPFRSCPQTASAFHESQSRHVGTMLDCSFWDVFDRIVVEHADRDFLITPHVRRTYRGSHDRALRVAGFLQAQGFGIRTDRARLQGYESGQDHLGILAGNGADYLELMFGAMRGRLAPVNLNYRYTAAELAQVLQTADVRVLAYEADLSATVEEALARTQAVRLLIEIGGAETPCIAGAFRLEDIAVNAGPHPTCVPSSDDLVVSCTGGTTGLPKAVLWRQGDLLAAMIGNPHTITNQQISSVEDLVESSRRPQIRMLLGPPLMHFSGFGTAMMLATLGGGVVFADPPRGMSAASVWRMVEREKVRFLSVVGDAFGRPLLEELQRGQYDLSSLRAILNGGAAMSLEVKHALHDAFDGKVAVTDGVGSTEGGIQARTRWDGSQKPAIFSMSPQTRLLAEDKTRILAPGDPAIGWLATVGRVPLGYLGDEARTRATFPTIDGQRFSIPGDRARWRNEMEIELLGRDSATINSGGEKVFSDEVERAIMRHASVREAMVVGRPSARWGEEVVALIALQPGSSLDETAILSEAAKVLARYKLPKAIIAVSEIPRTAAGKPDLALARRLATERSQAVHGNT